MKTFRLLMTIIALGLFSLSCSNEELNLQTDEAALDSELFARGGLPVITPSTVNLDNIVRLTFSSDFAKGKLILKTLANVFAGNGIRVMNFEGETINLDSPGGAFNSMTLNTGIKKKDMGDQSFSGYVIMENSNRYDFTLTIVSSKSITATTLRSGT